MILIRTYKEMTSGEKRSLTLSMKKYADAFAEKYQGNLSGFAGEADVIDTFYTEWLKDSLDSHYAWCSKKNEGSTGYTAKGYHEQDGFADEAKAKIRDILGEKLDLSSIKAQPASAPVKREPAALMKQESVEPMKVSKADGRGAKGKTKRKNATKLGRNDACPCGSGKKYKKCCLENGVEYTYVRGKFVAVS